MIPCISLQPFWCSIARRRCFVTLSILVPFVLGLGEGESRNEFTLTIRSPDGHISRSTHEKKNGALIHILEPSDEETVQKKRDLPQGLLASTKRLSMEAFKAVNYSHAAPDESLLALQRLDKQFEEEEGKCNKVNKTKVPFPGPPPDSKKWPDFKKRKRHKWYLIGGLAGVGFAVFVVYSFLFWTMCPSREGTTHRIAKASLIVIGIIGTAALLILWLDVKAAGAKKEDIIIHELLGRFGIESTGDEDLGWVHIGDVYACCDVSVPKLVKSIKARTRTPSDMGWQVLGALSGIGDMTKVEAVAFANKVILPTSKFGTFQLDVEYLIKFTCPIVLNGCTGNHCKKNMADKENAVTSVQGLVLIYFAISISLAWSMVWIPISALDYFGTIQLDEQPKPDWASGGGWDGGGGGGWSSSGGGGGWGASDSGWGSSGSSWGASGGATAGKGWSSGGGGSGGGGSESWSGSSGGGWGASGGSWSGGGGGGWSSKGY